MRIDVSTTEAMWINGQPERIVLGDYGYEVSVAGVIVGVFPTLAWAQEAAAYAACELCDRRRRHVQQVA